MAVRVIKRYTVQTEAKGYTVWTVGLSGSKLDCLAHCGTKKQAEAFIRTQRARDAVTTRKDNG